MTPYEMGILIHIYTTPRKHELTGTPLYEEVINQFGSMQVIRHDDEEADRYRLTKLGEAWLKSALSTPVPTTAYVDSHGKVIDMS